MNNGNEFARADLGERVTMRLGTDNEDVPTLIFTASHPKDGYIVSVVVKGIKNLKKISTAIEDLSSITGE